MFSTCKYNINVIEFSSRGILFWSVRYFILKMLTPVSCSSRRLGGGRWSYPEWSRKLRQRLPHPQHPRPRVQVSSSTSCLTPPCISLFFFSSEIIGSLHPAFRLPTSMSGQSGAEFGRITFEFETVCSADCELYFMMVREAALLNKRGVCCWVKTTSVFVLFAGH